MRRRSIPAEFVIMGTGIMQDNAKELSAELGVENYMHFLGYRTDCNTIIQAMDYYISASFSEGMSMSMLEAQMSGKPCFVSSSISQDSDLGIGLFHRIDGFDSIEWAISIENEILSDDQSVSREHAIQMVDDAGLSERKIISRLTAIYGSRSPR